MRQVINHVCLVDVQITVLYYLVETLYSYRVFHVGQLIIKTSSHGKDTKTFSIYPFLTHNKLHCPLVFNALLYLLNSIRFPQMLHYNLHFRFQQILAVLVISRSFQFHHHHAAL